MNLGDLDVDDVPVVHTLYGLAGYPETKNRSFLGRKFQLSTTAFVLVPSSVNRYGSLRLNPAAHFVGEFDRRKQVDSEKRRVTAPDPHGISGGGVWRLGRPEEFVSGTNTEKLVGIGIEYRKLEKLLVGVRISLVLAALAKVYCELGKDLPLSARIRSKISMENQDGSD